MQVKRTLKEVFYDVNHSGHYIDPTTRKPREYDFRLRLSSENVVCGFAIEAKNIKPNFPLVVSCVPRSREESWLGVSEIFSDEPVHHALTIAHNRYQNTFHLSQVGIYPQGEKVGRTVEQIGKVLEQVGKDKIETLTSLDTDIYEKWGQALASLHDIVGDFSNFVAKKGEYEKCLGVAVPLVVVPDETLWSLTYDELGNIIETPNRIDKVSYFCDAVIKDGKIPFPHPDYRVSHLEFVTISKLNERILEIFKYVERVKKKIL